jgi:hypothetical protein
LQHQFQKRGAGQVRIKAEFARVGDKIIGSAPWALPGDRHQERFMVFTIRDGKIVDMQGCVSRREAERLAKRS